MLRLFAVPRHDLQREELRQHYPHWDEFVAIRKKCDPQGRFLNPYLRSLFA